MKVSTEFLADGDPTSLVLVTSYGMNSVIAVISLYLVIILAFHLSKINCLNNLCNSSREKKHATTSKILCFLVAIFVLIRSLSQFGFFGLNYYFSIPRNLSEVERNDADAICFSICIITDLTLIIGTGLVYGFLWIRQRIFYIYPEFKMLSNRCIRTISAGSIVVWLLYMAVIIICYLTFVRFQFNVLKGCSIVYDVSDQWINGISISWLSIAVFMDIVLLGLFLYPLKKRESCRKENLGQSMKSSILVKRIKKATVLTIVAALSDIFAFVFSYTIGTPISISVFNLDMLINLFAMIGFYHRWRSLLRPWKVFSSRSDTLTRS